MAQLQSYQPVIHLWQRKFGPQCYSNNGCCLSIMFGDVRGHSSIKTSYVGPLHYRVHRQRYKSIFKVGKAFFLCIIKEPVLFWTSCQSTVYSWSLKTELVQTLHEAILWPSFELCFSLKKHIFHYIRAPKMFEIRQVL